MTDFLNLFLENFIEVLIWTWIFIGASFTFFLTGWGVSRAIDWHKKNYYLFKYLITFIYYRKDFLKWYKENKKEAQ